MHKTILLALLLVVWNCAGAQSPQETQALMNAALRLKQAAVLRTLEDCKAKGGSVQSCNTLLELTHQRELKIIERLNLAPTDPTVNMDEMSKELAACSNPHYGYVETVECWSQLSDRLDAARKGQSLLRSAGPATGATANRRSAQTAPTAGVAPPVVPPASTGQHAITDAEESAGINAQSRLAPREQDDVKILPRPSLLDAVSAALREYFFLSAWVDRFTNHPDANVSAVEGYSPYDNNGAALVGYEDHSMDFVASNSPEQTQVIKERIDSERQDKQTIAASGITGQALALAAGLLVGGLVIAALLYFMNKTRIAISVAVGATVGVLFAQFYSCGIDEVFDRWTTDWQRVTHYHFGCSAPQYPGEGLARTVVLTAPAWLALAVAVWFVLPTAARFTDRCLYAVGIDTRRIAARWSAPGVTPLSVISERPPQERIWPSRGVRLVGMGLMTLWMTYGLLHVLFGSWLFPERAGYEVVGGFLQFGVALSAFLWLRRRHTSAQKTLS